MATFINLYIFMDLSFHICVFVCVEKVQCLMGFIGSICISESAVHTSGFIRYTFLPHFAFAPTTDKRSRHFLVVYAQ